MKKLGCAKCGGTKKMKTGGMATKAMGPAKQPFAAGIPYYTGAGQTGPESMKNGGKVKKPLVKAQKGTSVKTKPIPNDVYKRDSTNYSNAADLYLNANTMKEHNVGRDSLNAIKSRYGTPNALEKRMKRTVGGYDLKKNGGVVKKPLAKAQFGKTTGKPTYSSKSFSKKSIIDPSSKDVYTNTYGADKKGIVRSKRIALENVTTVGNKPALSFPEKRTSMDTTGYSKGKSTFTIKQSKSNTADGGYNTDTGKFGSSSYNEWDIPRSKVKATIAQMKKGTGMAKKEAAAKSKSKKK